MSTLYSITIPSPVGEFHMILDTTDIVRASGFGPLSSLTKRLPQDLQHTTILPISDHPYATLVQAYFNGDKTALQKIQHKQEGTELGKKVWHAMSAVPYGETISYKELAEHAGSPRAIRAAGTICGLNRLILLVPCHRILKSDGRLGNYLYGPEIKAALLTHEQASFSK